MKKGISIWAFEGTDLRENLKLAASLGFDGVELSFGPEGPVSPATTKEEAAEIVAFAKELGLTFYSMASGQYWEHSITSDDEIAREKAKNVIRDHLRVASYFGCETFLVVPGWVKVNFISGLPMVDYETAYNRALSALKELAPLAEGYGVTIAIENVSNMLLVSPVEMREFVDKVGSPYAACYFDVGNILYNGCPDHWIRTLGSRIKKIHFKDYANSVRTVKKD